MAMKVKTFEHEDITYAVLKNGKPVYVDDDGKETTYDPIAMHGTIGSLNHEAKTNREAKEAAEAALLPFKDIDPKKAAKALETVANLDGKKLIDTGEVERLKKEITDSFQTQLDEAKAENTTLRTQYSSEKINSAFASSAYIKEKLAVPSDMAQATFGKHFVFKDGNLNPVDEKGNPIYSSSNPGELATFDEALERVVGSYTHRDSILKGSGHSGAGTTPPGTGGGKRTVSREQLAKMTPLEQQKIATSPDIKIVD